MFLLGSLILLNTCLKILQKALLDVPWDPMQKSDIFCCFHSIHNYHSLDHEFVIKSTHFGHFLFLSVIQKVLKWKLEEWLLFALDYAKYVYRNAKIYNENKDYEWITLNVWMHDYVSKWKIPLYYLSIYSLKFAERHFNMTLNMNSKLPDFSFW